MHHLFYFLNSSIDLFVFTFSILLFRTDKFCILLRFVIKLKSLCYENGGDNFSPLVILRHILLRILQIGAPNMYTYVVLFLGSSDIMKRYVQCTFSVVMYQKKFFARIFFEYGITPFDYNS